MLAAALYCRQGGPLHSVYERLAAKLDDLPHGFPRTDSGVELRILAKIFSPEDAAMALKLLPVPEAIEALSRRLRHPAESLRPLLDGMVARGQIASFKLHGEKVYLLAPFIVGFYEFQLPRMDAELATLFEEYLPHLLGTVGGVGPAIARVVPVNARISGEAEVLPYESVRGLIAKARSFLLMKCICRTEQAELGKPCSHTLETCMAFSPEEDAFDGTLPTGMGRPITREEALAVLDLAEREGLVHSTYNTRSQQTFVCNCCSCCCGFLRSVKEFGAPHVLVRSNWVAAVDAASCIACGDCVGGRCPMDAIVERDGSYEVIDERCFGCGVCTVICPTDAITLMPRPRSQRTTPPQNLVGWAFSRTVHRRGALRAVGQFGSMMLKAARPRLLGRRASRVETAEN
jgi:electron transport complex protein RnfB